VIAEHFDSLVWPSTIRVAPAASADAPLLAASGNARRNPVRCDTRVDGLAAVVVGSTDGTARQPGMCVRQAES
jgi:hypothetical protein